MDSAVPLITKDDFRKRQNAARQATEAAGFAALLAVGRSFYDRPGDLAYLTGHFPPFPTAVFSEQSRGLGHAFFLLPVHGEPVLLTDPRRHRADLVAVADVRASADLGAALIALLRERGLTAGTVAVAGDDLLPAPIDRELRAKLPGLTLVPDDAIVAALRRRKSAAEIDLLRAGGRAADAGIMAVRDLLTKPGVTERQLCAAGIAATMLAGADFVRYFRVHSGPWSSAGSRWPQATDRVIADGEIVVVDNVGALGGYGFDVNRTLVKGEPGEQDRAMLETAARATDAAVAACVAGARVSGVTTAARAVTDASPFATSAPVMIGHAIGIETVELPYLEPESETVLEPGMVLCIEPGIFISGGNGVSIEQEVVIREAGPPEVITPTPLRLW
ncbi:MAG: Xaa-Pro peptidase family protein [Thermomicrobiales bacterium]